jgi:uncharacterized protein (TIGR02145 family)
MKTKHFFLLSALAFLACTSLQAQVRIGDDTAPAAGAVLDLNSAAKGGLILSNVSLTDLRTIPGSFVSVGDPGNADVKAQFRGAMVYHTGGNDIAAGIYIWSGKRWTPVGAPATTSILEWQGVTYSIAKFGDAGWWMTENLRSTSPTYSSDGNSTQLKERGNTEPDTTPYYTYPDNKKQTFEDNPRYGLLYNWSAASGRTTDPNPTTDTNGIGNKEPTTTYRGVCPEGWHLPGDYEWSQLEKEIATNPGKYSSQNTPYSNLDSITFFPSSSSFNGSWRPFSGTNGTYDTFWGRQMKSLTPVNGTVTNGTSNSCDDGGFDALLLGYVNSSGNAYSYNSIAYFWSSSSLSSGIIYRYLSSNDTGMRRVYCGRSDLFSVRCKKNSPL